MTIEDLEEKVEQCRALAMNRNAAKRANVSMPCINGEMTVITIGAYNFDVPCSIARQLCEQVEQWCTAKLGEVIYSINQEALEDE